VKECVGCKQAKYCGKGCQTSHWKAGHKTECKAFQKAANDDPDSVTKAKKSKGSKSNSRTKSSTSSTSDGAADEGADGDVKRGDSAAATAATEDAELAQAIALSLCDGAIALSLA
jgi:SET and MYND domain-containing protein